MGSHSEYNPETVERICKLVAQGQTLRQISAEINVCLGTILNWATRPEHIEQYVRAREAASDIFETDIIEAAMCASPETAAADRVKIDALKWVAARRAPKKYGDKIDVNHGGQADNPIVTADLPPDEAYKLLLNGGK